MLKAKRDLLGQKKEARQAIFDKVKLENRSRTPEETTQWDTLGTEIAALENEVRFLEDGEREARANATVPVNTGAIGNRDSSNQDYRDLSKFSLIRGLQLMVQGKELDGVEAEVNKIARRDAEASNITLSGFGVPAFLPVSSPEQRAGQTVTLQTTNPGDQGGVTVATEVNELIKALWQKSFLGQVGARRLAGLQGNQSFPVQLTKPTIQLVSEIQQLADDGVLFGSLAMSPNRRGTSIPVSKQLLLQSSIDVNALILDNINMGLDLQLNIDAMNALLAAITGANGNLIALGTNGAAPDYASVVGLETLIANVDADTSSMYYLTNSKVRGKLKLTPQLGNTTGIPVWNNGRVNDYPAIASNIVPSALTKGSASGVASAIVFGNFKDLYVGMWGGVDYVIDPYALKKNAEVEITANMWWDTKVARTASFAGIKDALTA